MGIYFTILFVTGGSSFARKTIYHGSSHAGGRGGGGGGGGGTHIYVQYMYVP